MASCSGATSAAARSIRKQPLGAGVWTFEDVSEKRPVTAELTPREREIAALLVEGKTSKIIARETGLSPRTVEMHRAKLMRKFSAVDLVRAGAQAGGRLALSDESAVH